MRDFLLLLFLVFTIGLQAQKKYSFTNVLIYEHSSTLNPENKSYDETYLISKKANQYHLVLDHSDSLNYKFDLIDQDGVSLKKIEVKKNDFIRSQSITVDCKIVSHYSNPFKNKTDDYDFHKHKDTVIDNISYYHYSIASNKSKKYKIKKRLSQFHYVVTKDHPDFLPFLQHSTVYEEWKKHHNIPNGYPVLIYYVSEVTGKTTSVLKLKEIASIDKYVIIPKECDYTVSGN